uniref:30S ribosomal protein 3, chloroplastic n=1 Tax=Cyanidiococcus yangmingshanensis TaxID=2690220 RepID=A0A7G5VUF1_9RHOD|nr:ORF171 [Cyanidiococcus yangmingshanensis]QMX77318.1 ORF171 [Cyanidiococcus yangmingshanensis]UNJ15933.1 putative ribosomal protein 3 [Cyanidioschyzonaceae sp. 3]WDB00376.1 putative ribosomal protein 3 [Cyanidiococcus yangmingshanensis]
MQLKLKVVSSKQLLAMAVDQLLTPTDKMPVTGYYFWPRTDAWNLLKTELESKIWIWPSERKKILDEATYVINHWQNHAFLLALISLVYHSSL